MMERACRDPRLDSRTPFCAVRLATRAEEANDLRVALDTVGDAEEDPAISGVVGRLARSLVMNRVCDAVTASGERSRSWIRSVW